ncbi:MAG: P-loop NTPase fold protein, partial [Amphiplicatus sp.]
MIIPDNETEIDLLYYEAISKTVIDLLNSAGETPLTIGVHGDWGAGKSSILKMLAAEFEDSDDTLCIVFNGWLFQDFEDTKAV